VGGVVVGDGGGEDGCVEDGGSVGVGGVSDGG
jgi:hypothetical protein